MAETFGQTEKCALSTYISASQIWACKFQSGSAGELVSITPYLKQYEEYTPHVKCAIYNADKSLVTNGITEEKQIGSGQDDWMTFNFSTYPSVAAATDYYLAIWGDTQVAIQWEVGGSQQIIYDNYTYNNWPDPIVQDGSYDYVYSIYATYEEAPPPAKKTLVQAALISVSPLIVLPTLREILRFAEGC